MSQKIRSKYYWRAVCAGIVCLVVSAVSWGGQPGRHPVLWFGSFEPVPGASSQLIRTDGGITGQVRTNSLTPGDAYTLWMVVFNFPEFCAAPYACNDGDIGMPGVEADVLYLTGKVIGGSGMGGFAGHMAIGDTSGSIFNVADAPFPLPPAVGLLNPGGAEVHLVVHTHGQKLPEYMPSMIQSFAGGCVDPGAPFSGVFIEPEWGEPGPNACESQQVAVHPSPYAP